MKRRVFLFWMYSNLVILFIPIAIAMFVLVQSQRMLKDEVQISNETLLQQVQQSIDGQVMDIRRLGIQLSLNPKLLKFVYADEFLSNESRLKALELISELHSYTASNGTIADLYVYIKNSQLGITTNTKNQADILFSLQHKDTGISFNEWKSIMDEAHPGAFIDLNRNQAGSSDSLVFIQSIPVQDLYNAPARLVVKLNQDRFITAIKGITPENEQQLYIFNHKGELVMSTSQSNAWKELKFANMTGKKGMMEQKVNGENVAVSYFSSNETDWTYVVTVPTNLYSAKVENSCRLCVVSFWRVCSREGSRTVRRWS